MHKESSPTEPSEVIRWAEGEVRRRRVEAVGIEQSAEFSRRLVAKASLDLINTHLADSEYIKKNVPNVLVGAVGLITQTQQAEEILQAGKADVIFLARELLRNVDFPLKAVEELGVVVRPAVQYQHAWARMLR